MVSQTETVRAVVSKQNFNKVMKLANLPIDVSFDKALTIILLQIGKGDLK